MPVLKIVVEPTMLTWVRQRAGLSIQELADKVGTSPEKVDNWETHGEITVRQAEKVASVTHAPFGYLYLDEPPEESLPISDFRTVGSRRISSPSLELVETIDLAIARQEWYREYSMQIRPAPLGFVGSVGLRDNVLSTAKMIRETFGLTTENRSQTLDWGKVFKGLREAIEAHGVLVMRTRYAGEGSNRPLKVSEFRGFALSDPFAPLLFINGKDHVAAQIFTLMHELVHIFLGLSGISNLSETYSNSRREERFCNAVAAEILVPESELRAFGYGGEDISHLVRHFKVSRLVILRRLRDLGLLSPEDFSQRYKTYIDELEEEEIAKSLNKSGSGPGYYSKKIRSLSKPFLVAILESTLEGRSLPTEAFRLLGVKSFDQVRILAQKLETGKY